MFLYHFMGKSACRWNFLYPLPHRMYFQLWPAWVHHLVQWERCVYLVLQLKVTNGGEDFYKFFIDMWLLWGMNQIIFIYILPKQLMAVHINWGQPSPTSIIPDTYLPLLSSQPSLWTLSYSTSVRVRVLELPSRMINFGSLLCFCFALYR